MLENISNFHSILDSLVWNENGPTIIGLTCFLEVILFLIFLIYKFIHFLFNKKERS